MMHGAAMQEQGGERRETPETLAGHLLKVSFAGKDHMRFLIPAAEALWSVVNFLRGIAERGDDRRRKTKRRIGNLSLPCGVGN